MMENKKISVRRARAEDARAIADIEIECFARPWSYESVLYDLTENEKSVYVVAEMDGRVCGYAGMWIVVGEGQITNVAVTSAARRLHAATEILELLFAEAAAAGAESFTLEVRASNEPAIKLYSGLGFREAGVRRGYYEDNGENAIIMWK